MVCRILALVLLTLLLASCNSGFPREAGRYQIQAGSLIYDGEAYRLLWADRDGTLRRASGDDVRLVRGEETYLEMGSGSPIVHLRAEERVELRDRAGNAAGWWLPFLLGTTLGRGSVGLPAPEEQRPTYRYPPRAPSPGETVGGSQTAERPLPPERRVQSAPGSVSGQAGGTGGGIAATTRGTPAVAGQAGGSGAGTAATAKGSGAASGQVGGTGAGTAAGGKSGVLGGKPSSGIGGARSSGGFRGGGGRRR